MLRLKFERTARNLSQEKLGVAARVPQPTIALIECGRLIPTAEQLDRLSDALGVAADALLRHVEVVEK